MKEWKIGVSYERYGYLTVSADEAKNEEEAVKIAEEKLKRMCAADLDRITEYLEDSEEIDPEAVIEIPE